MKAAAGGKGSRTGSLERLFPTLLITRAVDEVENMIEEKGVKDVLELEEIMLQHRRRRIESEARRRS